MTEEHLGQNKASKFNGSKKDFFFLGQIVYSDVDSNSKPAGSLSAKNAK